MKRLVLERDNSPAATLAKGTLGWLPQVSLVTLELPWADNKVGRSCIPEGEYPMWFGHSPRFEKNLWHIEVPNRRGILIHTGNFLSDTEGCILVGVSAYISMKPERHCQHVLTQSRLAYDRLTKFLTPEDKWSLRITYASRG